MNAQEEVVTGKEMPAGMRWVVTVVMFFLALYFLVTVISMSYADAAIFLSKGTMEATVTGKSEAKGRNGRTYYVQYSFKIDQQEYSRKVLFGLAGKKTRLTKAQYDSVEVGGPLEVVYSKLNPTINRFYDDKYKDDGKIWMILGFLVFGAVSVNEIRLFMRKKKGE